MSWTLDDFLGYHQLYGCFRKIKDLDNKSLVKCSQLQKFIMSYPITELENTEYAIFTKTNTKCTLIDIDNIKDNPDEQLVTLSFEYLGEHRMFDLLDFCVVNHVGDKITSFTKLLITSNLCTILEANRKILEMFPLKNIISGYPGYAITIGMNFNIQVTFKVKSEDFSANQYVMQLTLFDMEKYKENDIEDEDKLYNKGIDVALQCMAQKINKLIEYQNSGKSDKITKLCVHEYQNQFEIIRKHTALSKNKRCVPLLTYKCTEFDISNYDVNILELNRINSINMQGFYTYVLIDDKQYDIFDVFDFIRVLENKHNKYDFRLIQEYTLKFNSTCRFVDICKLFPEKMNASKHDEICQKLPLLKHWIGLYKTYVISKAHDFEFRLELHIKNEFKDEKRMQLIVVAPELNFLLSDEYNMTLHTHK